jgi:hypothetical protein
MSTDSSKFHHIAYPVANEIARQIDNTVSAPLLCQAGIAYPTAVALAAIISTGSGGALEIDALFRLGFSASDAAAIVAACNTKGPH